jgi:glutamate transport system substrate-binding protein
MDAGKTALKGKKVCSATGSTPIQRVKDEQLTEASNISEFKTYSECVSQLLDKKVDTVTTDDAILKGYAAQRPGKLKVVGKPFTEEPYGVGMNKDDKALREAVSNAIEAHEKNGDYKKAYDATLGLSGVPAPKPPPIDRYPAS